MGLTINQIWNCEQEYSPGLTRGAEAQLLKVGEEYGEVCDALLRHDTEALKEETGDMLNTIFGFALHVYSSPAEVENRIMLAIHKMALKYSEE